MWDNWVKQWIDGHVEVHPEFLLRMCRFQLKFYGLVLNGDRLWRNKNDSDLDVQRKAQCNLVTMPNADWPSFDRQLFCLHHLPPLSVHDPVIRIPDSNPLLAFRPMHLIQPNHVLLHLSICGLGSCSVRLLQGFLDLPLASANVSHQTHFPWHST
jgi:hypothetical protein